VTSDSPDKPVGVQASHDVELGDTLHWSLTPVSVNGVSSPNKIFRKTETERTAQAINAKNMQF